MVVVVGWNANEKSLNGNESESEDGSGNEDEHGNY